MNIIEKIDKQKLLLASMLIVIGVISRILLHDFFNGMANPWDESGFGVLDVFFITAVIAIISGILIGKYYTLIVPIAVLTITDTYYAFVNSTYAGLALYTSWLFLFTISGYVFIALLGLYLKRKSKLNFSFFPKLMGIGVLGVIIYDLWTNFGFWLTYSKLGWYPATIQGLATVYSGGIPFMIWHLLSTTIAISVVAVPIIYFKEHKILTSDRVLKPMEQYVIAGTTVILVILSIVSAIM